MEDLFCAATLATLLSLALAYRSLFLAPKE